MGIASQDVTGDGRPEVFLTSQADNKLQTLVDGATGPTYEDIALQLGVTATRPFVGGDVLPSTAWHAEFQDVNNDGLVDLFVAKGNVEAEPGYATRDPNDLLLGRADGTFVEAAEEAGIVSYARSRGAALVDLNLDGLLDLVVVNRSENVTLWRNVGRGDAAEPAAMGHWIAVRLRQPAPNVDAVGAWVEARIGDRTVAREVTVGGGHAERAARRHPHRPRCAGTGRRPRAVAGRRDGTVADDPGGPCGDDRTGRHGGRPGRARRELTNGSADQVGAEASRTAA